MNGLIAFNEGLAEALFNALQDPAIYLHINDSPPANLETYRLRCKKLEKTYSPDGTERWLNWAVQFENEIVGYVQATVYPIADDGMRDAEFAYAIHSRVWGKSVAYAACTEMLAKLRTEFQVTQLWLTIEKENARSIRLAKRLGLEIVPNSIYPHTNFADGDIVMRGKP